MFSIENNLDNVKINVYYDCMTRGTYHHGDLKEALIEAGIKILKEEGINALTLRSAARAVGVSHSAPYAHFKDKQALLAAFSTRGFHCLFGELVQAVHRYETSPRALLIETGWAYIEFAMAEPALFQLMFSGILENEHSYPEFMASVQLTFRKLVEVVEAGQHAKLLRPGAPDETAIAVWSLVHGFVSLYQEHQLPGQVLERHQLKELFASSMSLMFINIP